MRVVWTGPAVRDLEECLFWTRDAFGVPAARRYQGLVKMAALMIGADPLLSGSKQLGAVEQRIRLYHLRHSRNFAAVGNIVVKRPRHFLAYHESREEIRILRLLHDQMDLDSSGLFER